jgi:hypothetical protein
MSTRHGVDEEYPTGTNRSETGGRREGGSRAGRMGEGMHEPPVPTARERAGANDSKLDGCEISVPRPDAVPSLRASKRDAAPPLGYTVAAEVRACDDTLQAKRTSATRSCERPCPRRLMRSTRRRSETVVLLSFDRLESVGCGFERDRILSSIGRSLV